MKARDIIVAAKGVTRTKLVYGEPIHSKGVTVIPAAKVSAGGGGGESPQSDGPNEGSGGGFGGIARPVGVFVIRGSKVSWRPAIDVNRLALVWAVVALSAMRTVRVIVKAKAAR